MTRRTPSQGGGLLAWLARAAIALIILVIVAIAFLADQIAPPTEPEDTSLPTETIATGKTAVSAGLIKAYFTTPDLVYPDKRDQRKATTLETAVLADVAAATRTIEIASFDFDLTDLTDALIAAKRRGVKVRLVIDSENLASPEVAATTGQLQKAGIPIVFDDREAFMHNKFLVIDARIAWFGSWNLTENDTYRNNNNMVRLRSQLAARGFQEEFNQMFAGTFGPHKVSNQRPQIVLDETPVTIYFSPEDGVAKYVIEQIKNAKKSVRFMTFSFTSQPIAQAMIDQVNARRIVQGVFERQNASGTGAVFDTLQNGHVDVLEDGSCYILHHKTIIIDDRIVITGSYNFTNSAERDNDETLVIIEDPELAKAYRSEFDRVYALAKSPNRCK